MFNAAISVANAIGSATASAHEATRLPPLTASQQEAQTIIDKQDYLAMLRQCLPTLKAEHYAGQFLLAELTRAGDVQVQKSKFIKASRKIIGGLPPFTEVALQLIANQGKK